MPRLKKALSSVLMLAASSCGPGLTVTGPMTHAQWVCESVDECSQGGASSWLQSCDAEALALQQQATASACQSQYDGYYACADDHFQCEGVTSQFPGCDPQLSALEGCLNAATAQSACASYAAQLAACPGDAGTSPSGSPVPTPCTLNLQCQAQCYLSNVSNVCSPGLSELAAIGQCANACPP